MNSHPKFTPQHRERGELVCRLCIGMCIGLLYDELRPSCSDGCETYTESMQAEGFTWVSHAVWFKVSREMISLKFLSR